MVVIYTIKEVEKMLQLDYTFERQIELERQAGEENDGTEFKELAYGEYTNINVTSDKIFFSDYRTGEVYYTSTTNPGEISLFSPGTDK